MKLYTGFESESFKYVYGERDKRIVPFDENKTVSPVIGKNDWAAVQLLLYSEDEMMVSVNGEASFYYKGPIDQVRVEARLANTKGLLLKSQLIGLIQDDDTRYKSDILLNQSSLHAKERQVQQVMIRVDSDEACPVGKHEVQISLFHKNMFEDETLLKKLNFDIEVVDYTLKCPKDYDFYLDLWQHNSNIARKYDVPLWSDEHFEIMDGYIESLSNLGQKAISIIASEIPWSGQGTVYDQINHSDLYEYNMASLTKKANGQWSYDFSVIKRYIEMCMAHGIKEEIEIFGLSNVWMYENFGFGKVVEGYSDGIRLRYFDEADGLYKYIRCMEDLEGYIRAINDFFVECGWADKVRILADEPDDVDVFRKKVMQLSALAPSFRYKVAINHVEFMGEDIPGVTDFCPFIECISKKYDEFKAMKGNVKGRLSYYVCCGPLYPNTFIESPLVESRLIPWAARHMNIDGFLRWNYTVWPDEPLKDIRYRYPVWPAGDTNFVYPGKDGKPIYSLRYWSLKRGIRDYQLMTDYEKSTKDSAFIEKSLNQVFKYESFYKVRAEREEMYSLDELKYEGIANELLRKLSK